MAAGTRKKFSISLRLQMCKCTPRAFASSTLSWISSSGKLSRSRRQKTWIESPARFFRGRSSSPAASASDLEVREKIYGVVTGLRGCLQTPQVLHVVALNKTRDPRRHQPGELDPVGTAEAVDDRLCRWQIGDED